MGCSGLLIDATRKGPFPPVGLPKKSFMENALKIWREEEMPELNLKIPGTVIRSICGTHEDDRHGRDSGAGDYFQQPKK